MRNKNSSVMEVSSLSLRLYYRGYDFGSVNPFQACNTIMIAVEKEFAKFQIVDEKTGKIYFPVVKLVEGGKIFDNQRTIESPISFEGD